jgi:magnesium transporter
MITIYRFHNGDVTQHGVEALPNVAPSEVTEGLFWVDLFQPTAEEEEQIFSEWFHVGQLVMSDIRQADPLIEDIHFPKVDEFPDFIYLILRGAVIPKERDHEKISMILQKVRGAQLNIILNRNVIVTHRWANMNVVSTVMDMFRKNPRYSERGPDFAVAMMMDTTIDHVITIGDMIEERLEQLESLVLRSTKTSLIIRLLTHRRQIHLLQRAAAYQKDLAAKLASGTMSYVEGDEAAYYRDVLDHHVRALDQLDLVRIMVDGLMDLYFSMSSNRLNQIMRILTAISTVFLPITFITSWYGMNFENMPELTWQYGYIAVMTLIALVAGFMLLFSRRRGWLD